ncbi:MAG TPA: xanthine dehydrogenase family protein subunit M [Acidilobales archaeon]|nr:xanthine dehydrogenase family protein subunit M [Acidilobales archaeon]
MVDISRFNTHILPVRFEYFAPETLDEVIELLKTYGEEAKILAGGTDLLVKMKQRLASPKYVISLRKVKELDFIEVGDDGIHIGAATKLRRLERSDVIRRRLPVLYEAIKSMASVQVRNMATIGGNLCNASPAADTAPPLLVLDAKLKIMGPEGARVVPIDKFFLGPGKTVLKPTELLTEIIVPHPKEGTGTAFIKVSRVAMDLAKVNIAVALRLGSGDVIEHVRIALGAVAPTPMRAYKAEEFLLGKEFSEENIVKAAEIVSGEVRPITDIRSTAEYRRELSKVLTKRALKIAYERIRMR